MAKHRSALGESVRTTVDLARNHRIHQKVQKRRTLSVASEIGDMVADAAFYLRQPLVEVVEEILREGVRRLAEAEAEATKNPDFEFPRRTRKGRRWI